MLKVLSSILCDLDPKVMALGQKAGICDGVPSTSALVRLDMIHTRTLSQFPKFTPCQHCLEIIVLISDHISNCIKIEPLNNKIN